MYLFSIFSPFLGSAIAGLGGRWLGARGSAFFSVLGIFLSVFVLFIVFYEVCLMGSNVSIDLGEWFHVHSIIVNWGFYFDSLTICMMCTVSLVSLCVHIYAIGYMQTDPHLPRFMCYLSMFTGFMLVLVTSDNMVQLLVGWEGIGVCSYLLISFWYTRLSATKSAIKAMLVNRVSDSGLLISVILMWWYLGSLDFAILTKTTIHAYYLDWICGTMLIGAVGKSAQLGLHVWLPDSMEGPTPVSALLHAATLVTAGVYVIARTCALWECSPDARTALTIIGCLTSLMAATVGFVQNDLKRVIAYSTCSQLGYMMVALGLGHYSLAIYHLMTHALFKALLFLCAGVVIHQVSDIQDIRRHGGIHSFMPWTWSAMLVGSLSLTGVPFLSGFYSKDAILERTWSSMLYSASLSYYLLVLVALFTSYYSFRLLWCSFVSPINYSKKLVQSYNFSFLFFVPLLILSLGSITAGFFLSDMLIGLGTDFWHGSILVNINNSEWCASHFIPSRISLLPLFASLLGLCLAAAYNSPLSIAKINKSLYLFFYTRWQFDPVYNQQVAYTVLVLGKKTRTVVDKGVLELLGPRGISNTIKHLVPLVREWQTGTVHDYAIIYKLVLLLGLYAFFILNGQYHMSIILDMNDMNIDSLLIITTLLLFS